MGSGNTGTRFGNPYLSSIRYAMLRRSRRAPRNTGRTTLRFVDGATLQEVRNRQPGLIGATPSQATWGIESEARRFGLRSPGTSRSSKPLELYSGLVVTVSGWDATSVRECARRIVDASGMTPDTPSPRRKHRQASASLRLAAQRNDALLETRINNAYWADAWSEIAKGTVAVHVLALVELHGKQATMASLSLVQVGNRPTGYDADKWAINPQRRPIMPVELLADVIEFLDALPNTD